MAGATMLKTLLLWAADNCCFCQQRKLSWINTLCRSRGEKLLNFIFQHHNMASNTTHNSSQTPICKKMMQNNVFKWVLKMSVCISQDGFLFWISLLLFLHVFSSAEICTSKNLLIQPQTPLRIYRWRGLTAQGVIHVLHLSQLSAFRYGRHGWGALEVAQVSIIFISFNRRELEPSSALNVAYYVLPFGL